MMLILLSSQPASQSINQSSYSSFLLSRRLVAGEHQARVWLAAHILGRVSVYPCPPALPAATTI
jgi:hypothetical protein